MCEAGRTSPAAQACISNSCRACPAVAGAVASGSKCSGADARFRCRLEEMEPCGARACSDGHLIDGCVAAWIADDRLKSNFGTPGGLRGTPTDGTDLAAEKSW